MKDRGDALSPNRRAIFALAVPIALANVSNTMLMVVDAAMLGRYSTNSLAAVGMATTVLTLFQIFSMSFAVGVQAHVSRALGSRTSEDQASLYGTSALLFSLVLGTALFMVCSVSYGGIVRLLGADEALYGKTASYLHIMRWSAPGFCFNTMFQTIHNAHGRTIPVMLNSLLMTLINLVLDYLLIYGRFGFPEMGIEGAALASLTALCTGILFIGLSLIHSRTRFCLNRRHSLKDMIRAMGQFISLGFSATVEWLLWLAGTFILSRFLVQNGGAAAVAVYHVGMRIQRFFMMGAQGYSNAALTLVSRSVGAGRYDHVSEWNWKILKSGVLTGAVGMFACALFPYRILGIFMKPSAIEALPMVPVTMALMGSLIVLRSINVITASSLRSMGNLTFFFVTLLISFLINVGLSHQFIVVFGLGATGAFMAMTFDELTRNIANVWRFRSLLASKVKETTV